MAATDAFTRHQHETPENKLELIGGKLIVGNSLAGSRYLLHDLLRGWSVQAVLPWASNTVWREALREAFAMFQPPVIDTALTVWQEWAGEVAWEPRLEPAGPLMTDGHALVRGRLNRGLMAACATGSFGATFGRDFVLHLGEDALTPDASLIGRQAASERLCSRHLTGPADLVIEVLLPGHERQDREVKARIYEASSVPDFWVIDPERQAVDFLRLQEGRYVPASPSRDGRYRPASIPGLALVVERLWGSSIRSDEAPVFEVEKALPAGWSFQEQRGIAWDDWPFDPRPGLNPLRITFDELISWCPRARFEYPRDRTIIDSYMGTRNVLGMLTRTLGLIDTVRLLPPRVWTEGLLQAERERAGDAERKARWWELASTAAARLRQELGVSRIGVIGDLLRSDCLHFWSRLSLVVWGLGQDWFDAHDLLRDLDNERVIELIDPDRASASQREALGRELLELP
jgi:Uma2 family endonuclease